MSHLQAAQDALCCEMCPEKENVNWFCYRCKEYLCEKCSSVHTKTKQTRTCTVIPRDFLELMIKSESTNSDRECPNHSNETIKFRCRKCKNIEVCVQCILQNHVPTAKHSIELIGDATKDTDTKRQQYQINLLDNFLKSQLRHCEKRISETNTEIEQSQHSKEELVSAIHARAEVLEQQLKNSKQKMLQRVDKLFTDSQNLLHHRREQCCNFRRKLDDTCEQLKLKKISSSDTDLQTFLKENIDKLKTEALPGKPDSGFNFSLLAKGSVDDIFGDFTKEAIKHQTSIKDAKTNLYAVKVLGVIQTGNARGIGKICPVSDKMAWIVHSNKNSVEKIDQAGKKVRVLQTPFPVQDIAVDSDKDMVLTGNSTVWGKDLLNEKSEFIDIRNLEPYVVKGVTLMTGKNILVCAQLKGDPGKVVQLSWKGEILMEIKDVQEDPVLSDPYRVAFSIFSGDIAIACSDKALLYSMTGKLKSKWTGLRADFNPHGITFDNNGNVLVSCYKHNLVYMLKEVDQEGQILLDGQKHIMVANPWAVAVDELGKLWLAGNQGVIHIIKYITNYQ